MTHRLAPLLLPLVLGCGAVPAPPHNEPLPAPTSAPVTPAPVVRASNEPVEIPMVRVPAGGFVRGCDAADPTCPPDEQPRRRVELHAYVIDATQVTVAAYRRCVEIGACSDARVDGWGWENERHPSPRCNYAAPGRENHPMNCVDWTEASTYCAWAQKRLPTEAEWEKAMRGADGPRAPWGHTEPSCAFAPAGLHLPDVLNVKGCPETLTHPAGGGSAGPYGTHDLPGNVWEWVHDDYRTDSYASDSGNAPKGPETGQLRTTRGIRWYSATYPNSAESEEGRIVNLDPQRQFADLPEL